MRGTAIWLMLGLAACADVPALDDRISDAARNAAYPALIDVNPLIAQASAVPPSNTALVGDVAARIAQLNARANRLRGPIIAAPRRAQMLRGLRSTPLP